MFMVLQREAAAHQLNLSDLFLMSGLDHRGTIHGRHIPVATIFKTGTLNQVSSLAGVMPTRDRGLVWFAILNNGTNPSGFRTEQDKLLQNLVKKLQPIAGIPESLAPHSGTNSLPELGAASRNEIVFKG